LLQIISQPQSLPSCWINTHKPKEQTMGRRLLRTRKGRRKPICEVRKQQLGREMQRNRDKQKEIWLISG